MKFHVVVSTVYEIEAESEAGAIDRMEQGMWPLPMISGISEVYDPNQEYTIIFRQPFDSFTNKGQDNG